MANYPYSQSYLNGLGDGGDGLPTDPFFDPTPYTTYPSSPYSTPYSSPTIAPTVSGPGFDWGGFTTGLVKVLPNLVSSFKGNPYGATPYGQTGGQGAGGLSLTGQSILGGGSLGISSTTLLLLGAVALIFLMKK